MLTELDYHESTATRKIIAHVSDAESSNTSLTNILAIIDFILIGVKAIFFTEMGKPKSKLQIALSLPAIIRFISEVVKRINHDVKKPSVRVKALSNEQKVALAIDQSISKSANLKSGGFVSGKGILDQQESPEQIEPIKFVIKGDDIAKITNRATRRGGSNRIEF